MDNANQKQLVSDTRLLTQALVYASDLFLL